jgi:hypothetical protein
VPTIFNELYGVDGNILCRKWFNKNDFTGWRNMKKKIPTLPQTQGFAFPHARKELVNPYSVFIVYFV